MLYIVLPCKYLTSLSVVIYRPVIIVLVVALLVDTYLPFYCQEFLAAAQEASTSFSTINICPPELSWETT